MFVHDFTDDFFDDILNGDDAGGSSVFIFYDAKVSLLFFEIFEKFADLLGAGRKMGLPQDFTGNFQAGLFAPEPQEILGVEYADNIVYALVIDRDSGVPAFSYQRYDFPKG